MVVLDTNCLIAFFKGEGHVAAHLAATRVSSVAVPTVVLFELETGIAKSRDPAKRRRQLDTFLAAVTVLPFDAEDARSSALVRSRLEGAGTPIGPIDTLIAGIALARRATLATRNAGEFGRVSGLVLANWYDHSPPR